jgi:hypothetical protein
MVYSGAVCQYSGHIKCLQSSNYNENQLGANKGRFMLFVSTIFSAADVTFDEN